MSKKFVLAMLLFVAALNPLFASITDLDVEEEKSTQSQGGPRTSAPGVQVSSLDNELTLDISRYIGNVQVSVLALDGSSNISDTYYINGQGRIDMDFSGYATGCYSVAISLRNGVVYSGSFRIE
ncbi:MAG: hypothetical protein MJZ83_06745 [Bacteroidaceae bacterium]|nr:hypothetical protein [Bacteroidaceae bacterium]